jgi:hypothetical protein
MAASVRRLSSGHRLSHPITLFTRSVAGEDRRTVREGSPIVLMILSTKSFFEYY